jgi:hypothetical protein
MASFATGKWALRALSQSLAREFGPQGVHVSHAIIDGVIDIPRTKEWLKDLGPEAKLSADEVCFILHSIALLTESTDGNRLRKIIGGFTLNRRQTSPGKSTCDLQWRSGSSRCCIRRLLLAPLERQHTAGAFEEARRR